ncbi:hypothetical protein BDQ17DRAFT_1419224 [Cyathus striatus]|nr:hypothetical protein BDQ17DRAFT_1419224 [Cyathus striatus]
MPLKRTPEWTDDNDDAGYCDSWMASSWHSSRRSCRPVEILSPPLALSLQARGNMLEYAKGVPFVGDSSYRQQVKSGYPTDTSSANPPNSTDAFPSYSTNNSDASPPYTTISNPTLSYTSSIDDSQYPSISHSSNSYITPQNGLGRFLRKLRTVPMMLLLGKGKAVDGVELEVLL